MIPDFIIPQSHSGKGSQRLEQKQRFRLIDDRGPRISSHSCGPRFLTPSSSVSTGRGACSIMVLEKLESGHRRTKLEPHSPTSPETNSKWTKFKS